MAEALKRNENIEEKELELEGYNHLLGDIRCILQRGLTKAYKAVDNLKVQTYWQIGERVVREELDHKERADYGKRIIDSLSKDLNIDRRLFYRIVRFYRLYPIVVTVSPQLSWSHYEVLTGTEDNSIRQFYENASIRNSWSVRELKKKITNKEYEKARKKGEIIINLPEQLPSPEDVFKESYNWDFITLDEQHTEKELENSLLNNIQNTLLEFGCGFAFMGRQQKVLINNNWHKIDMVFYHIQLKCHVIVELKARALIPGDIEQVTKYLTYFRERKMQQDRDPIALVICKTHDKIDVYYSAGKNRDDIFVAEYKVKLPDEEDIKKALVKES